MAHANGKSGLTLTVLGCGTLGTAILSGIMASLADAKDPLRSQLIASSAFNASSASTPMEELPQRLPTRFYACVRRHESAKRIKNALAQYSTSLEIVRNENVEAVQQAEIVLLGCKPQMFRDILGAPGIREALDGKLLISILAGVTVNQFEEHLYGPEGPRGYQGKPCRIVRAMPNTASFVRESMTVIANPEPPLEPEQSQLISWIFNRVGRVVHLPPTAMDASTAVCGSGPAFMALVLESIADGGVAMGLPRAEAQLMAAQCMKGTASLVLNGEHPAILRDKVSTPGGCTIGGLLVLEEGRVRGAVARAVREATVVAGELGKGAQGVNGTRF